MMPEVTEVINEESKIDEELIEDEESTEDYSKPGKFVICIGVSINNDGERYYSVSTNYKSSGSGTPCYSQEEALECIKCQIQSIENWHKIKLRSNDVILNNSTKIRVNIPSLFGEINGNSLLAFGSVKKTVVTLADEIVPDSELVDYENRKKEDDFQHLVLDPLRDEIHKAEEACRKFGLPENTGISCLQVKDLKKLLVSEETIEAFRKAVMACVKFDLAMHNCASVNEWIPDKTDECGQRIMAMHTLLCKTKESDLQVEVAI